jgi:hypothetical protein
MQLEHYWKIFTIKLILLNLKFLGILNKLFFVDYMYIDKGEIKVECFNNVVILFYDKINNNNHVIRHCKLF